MDKTEENRLLDEYLKRDNRFPWNDWKSNIYHPRHPIGNLFQEHNHSILIDALNQNNIDLSDLNILDVGCGYGSWLRFLVELGANPENCTGVDLSSQRIEIARYKNPSISYYQQNIANLLFDNEAFDLVMQIVVFSSILDKQMQIDSAKEMFRVTKNGGIILWIDLIKINTNSLTSFSEKEVNSLFPNIDVIYRRNVHPKYFRRINGQNAWLSRSIYRFSNHYCEAQLLLLKKSIDAD
jgi:ubiquinone/menaquinone biosynthesis C-methylase UbiE